jgi:hypothetical protein
MGGACSTYGREERCIKVFGGENRGRRPLGRPGVDGRIVLRSIFNKWDVVHGLDGSGSGL